MFARNAEGAALVDLTEKGAGTEIAVFNPEVTGLNRVQDGPEQRERSLTWPFSHGKTSVTTPRAGS